MEGNNGFRPQEIIVSILKRLPVKYQIQFQSVCKNWKNLLKDPLFIADHLHHSSHRPSFLFQQLYRRNNPLCSDHRLQHGLLCMELYDRYVSPHKLLVWNPAIKEAREVPQATYPKEGSYRFCKRSVNKVLVYSLRTGSSKAVEVGNTLKDLCIYCEAATDNNGTIIWLAQNSNDDDDVIISFDVAVEVFTLIPTPALPHRSTSIPTFYENKPVIISYRDIGNSKYGFIDLWMVEEHTCF
ncbi:putative F-box protein At1g70960 [Neltuma alba]|uniref:putative F-box protein At1g70960 n=1 Tax=Neltuma alba TaxID=207710 RepID=UPI0010A46621|nr:putative F-box protein At1g70960 [Prosopis alba]